MDYYNYGVPNQVSPNPWLGVTPPPQMMNYQIPQTGQQVVASPELSFTWVRGREFARNCPMAPNTSRYFMDEQEPYLYKRTVDGSGRTSEFIVTRLEVEEETRPEEITPQMAGNFVTKDDFNSAMNDLKNMIAGMNKPVYNNKQPYNKGGK